MVIILLLASAVQNSFSQQLWDWGLTRSASYQYQQTSNSHALVCKAKFTTHNFRSAVFSRVYYYNNANISINQLDPLDYNVWPGIYGSMAIIRDTAAPSGASPKIYFFGGSSSNYARDYETDANDNFVVLCDNKGNGWRPTFPPAVSSNKDSTQVLLCKVKPGNEFQTSILWYKLYGGSSAEYATAIRKTPDGNFIVLAQTQSADGDVTGYNGGKDIWLFKISDADGSIIWKKTIGTPGDEIPTDLEILNDGSIVVSGAATSSSLFPGATAGLNSFLMKLDGTGNILWTRVFGGNGSDKISAFVADHSGGYVSISTTTSADGDYPVNNGGSDVYIFRHDAAGNIVWSKHYGFADNDVAGDVAITKCDSLIYVSMSKQYNGTQQPFTVFPAYSQNASIRIVLNSNGNQNYYYMEAWPYFYGSSDFLFNDMLTTSIAANPRGGIFTATNWHCKWRSVPPGDRDNVTRSFEYYDYGIPLRLKSFDTSICKGQIAWGTVFNVDSAFTDTLRNACGIDTLISRYKIHVTDGDSAIIKDTTLCYGVTYNGAPVFTSFTKNDTAIVATTCGPKQVITRNNIHVAPTIINPFVKDTTVCKGNPVQLIAYPAAASFLWQDGSTGQVYNAVNPGLYWVEVKDIYGCKTRDSMILSNNDLFLIAPSQITIQLPQTAILNPQTNGSIIWDYQPTLSCTVCQTTVANPTSTQLYTLSSQKDNCTLTASIKVIVNKSYYLYIPTAFTPDGNGNNDIYKVSTNLTGYFKMSLYNRYGQKIYETTNPGIGWDGNFKGSKQPVGGYTYVVEYDSNFTERQLEKGSFLLIR